jgi:Mg-chelatase subunit ChlD
MRVQGANKNPNLTQVTDVVVDTTTVTDGQSKQQIHNVFIIDASGSMGGSKYEKAISGVNELLVSISQDTDTKNTVTIVEFESSSIKRRVDVAVKIPTEYKGMGTGGSTPLNQALGETLEYIIDVRKNKFNESDKILVNVLTDGEENSSNGKYANKTLLGQYIKELEEKGVTVTFIGTKKEVAYAINYLSMDASNTMVHDNTAADITRSFGATVLARQAYSKSVSRGEDVKKSFYTKTIEI